jgi:hypothetical protein
MEEGDGAEMPDEREEPKKLEIGDGAERFETNTHTQA